MPHLVSTFHHKLPLLPTIRQELKRTFSKFRKNNFIGPKTNSDLAGKAFKIREFVEETVIL
jgi:hypothetical protein